MSNFNLTIRVIAPPGSRARTVAKLLKDLLTDSKQFTVSKMDEEPNSLSIIYHESNRTDKA